MYSNGFTNACKDNAEVAQGQGRFLRPNAYGSDELEEEE